MPWRRDQGVAHYAPLPTNEVDKEHSLEPTVSQPGWKTSRISYIFSRIFNIITVALAIYGLIAVVRPLIPATSLSCNCGDTIDEARARGCVYDALAAAWLPPHCRSARISAAFEASGPHAADERGSTWRYWADKNQTLPLTVEEVSLLPSQEEISSKHFFTTHEWHVQHCLFYWRKIWEAGRRARGFAGSDGEEGMLVIEKRYDTLMHVQHCMVMLTMRDVPLDSVSAEAGVALHSDEIHIAKPHDHHDANDPYDRMEGNKED